MKSKKAFTLVELLIIIAIIGLLAAIALPSIDAALKKSKVEKVQTEPNWSGVREVPVEKVVPSSVEVGGKVYYSKTSPDIIILDGVEYRRVQ